MPGGFLKYVLVVLTGCCFASSVAAQPLRAKATINRDTIRIGEPIVLQLKVSGADSAVDAFEWFSTADTLGHFEVVERQELVRQTENGIAVARQEIVITSFDSGYWQVPPFVSGNVSTAAIPVTVRTVPVSPIDDYRDIKEILPVKKPFNVWFALLIAGAVIALAIGVWLLKRWLRRRVKAVIQPRAKGPSAYDEALQALRQLEAGPRPEGGAAKVFHTTLDRILKQYIARHSGLALLVNTNKELQQVITSYRLPAPAGTALQETLQVGDAVKFAKFQPGAEKSLACLEHVRHTITTIHQQST